MRFFEVVLSGAALVAAAMAVEFNSVPSTLESGKSYTITYSPKDNTATTIILRQGNPGNLDTLQTITTSATGGSFTWTVPASLPNANDYALEIVQGNGTPNYSGLLTVTGSSAVSSSASSSASATSSSASSSSASASSTSTGKTTLVTSASASVSASPTSTGNSTISATRTPSATTGSSSSATSSGSVPQSTGAAGMLASSPVAIILGAVAALAFLN